MIVDIYGIPQARVFLIVYFMGIDEIIFILRKSAC